jgi:hypothetical protein
MVSSSARTAVAWISAPVLVAGALLAAAPAAHALQVDRPSVAAPGIYVVPAGITSIRVSLIAAAGFEPFCNNTGGRGGAVAATIPVTPGETLQFNVGNFFTQSASGNSSDIRRSPYTLDDRLVVAGGGGSAADFAGLNVIGNCTGLRNGPGLGGDGGSPAGLPGTGLDAALCGFQAGHPGGGGQLDGPGVAGGTCGVGGAGSSGTFGHGGVGGGSGTAVAPCSQGGGGGDGWYGGGGGGGTGGSVIGSPGGCTDSNGSLTGKTIGGGGGGGSSFAEASATGVVFTVGVNATSAGSVSIDSSLPTAPTAPASASAVGAATSATVSWTAPTSDGGSPVTGYSVTVSPGATVIDVGPAVRSTPVTGLSAGVTYSFAVRAINATGPSPAKTASAKGTTLTITKSASAVSYGSKPIVSGLLKTITGTALAARSVTILAKKTGATAYTAVGTATTNASGAYTLAVKPTIGTLYAASFAGGAGVMARSTAGVPISVRPRVTFALSDSTATRRQTVAFSGAVSPASANRTVFLQRLVSGTWTSVKSMKLSATSRFTFAWRPTTGADSYFRVLVPARPGYLAVATVKKLLTVA